MKLIRFSILLPLVLVSSIAMAQTKELRNVEPFTRIANDSSIDVYLQQGHPQRVEVSARKERIADIVTEVSGGQLHVSMKNQHGQWVWGKNDHFAVYVTVEKIEQIDLSGSGDLFGQGPISGNNMVINLRGSGDLNAEVNMSGSTAISISGSGDVKIRGTARTVNTEINGSGDADLSLTVADLAQFHVAGSGNIDVRGKAQSVEATVSGSGDLDASHFEAEKSRVRVSGSGTIHVFARTDLDALTSGSGEVMYYGNPARVTSHNSGSGSVSKAD